MTRSKQRPAARKPAQVITAPDAPVQLYDSGIIPNPATRTELQAFVALTGNVVLRQLDDAGVVQRIVIPASNLLTFTAMLVGLAPTALELRAHVEALATPAAASGEASA